MKRILTLAIAVAALVAMAGVTAEAGQRGWRSDGWRRGFTSGQRFATWERPPSHSCARNPYVHRRWQDTSRWDYHPGQYVWLGTDYGYIPRHWHAPFYP